MTTLIIAAGDIRKGDEAAPSRVVELLGLQPDDIQVHQVKSLRPGLAQELGPANEVVFIGADECLGQPWMEPVGTSDANETAQIVNLARRLFNFSGKAYVCHVPGIDFDEGMTLSPYAESHARQAASLIRRLLAVTPA